MPLEFVIKDYSPNVRIIENYRTFHKLNSHAMQLMSDLNQDTWQVLIKEKPYKTPFAVKYEEFYQTLKQMIEYVDDPAYNPDDSESSKWRSRTYNKIKESLNELNAELNPVLQQLDMSCSMGYQKPIDDRGGRIHQQDSKLEEYYSRFKEIFSGSSSDPRGLQTFEEILHYIQN